MADAAAIRGWLESQRDAEQRFLAELVRVPSDNPPGDCALAISATDGFPGSHGPSNSGSLETNR
jgi:hypothetical protein